MHADHSELADIAVLCLCLSRFGPCARFSGFSMWLHHGFLHGHVVTYRSTVVFKVHHPNYTLRDLSTACGQPAGIRATSCPSPSPVPVPPLTDPDPGLVPSRLVSFGSSSPSPTDHFSHCALQLASPTSNANSSRADCPKTIGATRPSKGRSRGSLDLRIVMGPGTWALN